MCGIFGIWHTGGKMLDLAALRRATTSLSHRGPDDEGYLLVNTRTGRTVLCGGDNTRTELGLPSIAEYTGVIGERFDLALGFRRLAILDLSPAGHQPMCSPDGSLWLIFNGEIYNYIELRSELAAYGHTFKTGTDSEVILAAYRQWGPDCLSHFNGMWAFAIWDSRAREVFVARDRFGVKPMYTVSGQGGTFAFSSEIKALLISGVVPFRPSPAAISRYIAQGTFPSHAQGETFFEGVQELPAGYCALVSPAGRQPHRYWSLPTIEQPSPSTDEAAACYSELFTDAVRLRLRADVPVGTCLSGGVDSSSIVAVAGNLMQTEHAVSLERLGDHQQTFSAVYPIVGPWDERRYIEQVVDRTGAAGNYISPTVERLWDDLEQLVWHQDEPFQSTSIFAQWCVMSLAHERGVTVLLDGQGADEVLGGYRPYAVWLGQLIRAGRIAQAVQEARALRSVTGQNPLPLVARGLAGQLPAPLLRRLRGSRMRQAVAGSGLRPELGQTLEAAVASSGEAYEGLDSLNNHLARLITEDSLPNLLRYEDRNSMAFSIESRVPFLDYRLVEYVFRQASHLRIHDGWTKWIQRTAVDDKLPADIVWRRDKVGFETPEQQWFRAGKSHLLSILNDDSSASSYLDMAQVRREAPGMIDVGNTAQVWRWVNLVLWLRSFERAL
ncbi:MAG: asparagine synthase (glutamine-hydrolyzing) [Chloroflexota bacterium]